jgi:hypothetical protein
MNAASIVFITVCVIYDPAQICMLKEITGKFFKVFDGVIFRASITQAFGHSSNRFEHVHTKQRAPLIV